VDRGGPNISVLEHSAVMSRKDVGCRPAINLSVPDQVSGSSTRDRGLHIHGWTLARQGAPQRLEKLLGFVDPCQHVGIAF
jgi:hypothetical protein